ncbi:hypothetical protein HDU67_009113 [Dinochytrium kinnereticum]|nr:hypothetical protein HDU67_009113 [Dinochytrium kinnereticum]
MPSPAASVVRLDNVAFFQGDALDFVEAGSVAFSPSLRTITAITPRKPSTPLSSSPDVTAIDCSGYLLLPGLIDVGAVQGHDMVKLPYVPIEDALESLHGSLKAGTTTAVLAGKRDDIIPSKTAKCPNIIRFFSDGDGTFVPEPNPKSIRLQPIKASAASASQVLGFNIYPNGVEGSGFVGLSQPPTPWRVAENMARILAASGLASAAGLGGILKAITSAAAATLGLDETGRLEVGCVADLILVNGALNATRVHATFLGGSLQHLTTSTSLSSSLSVLTLNTYYVGPNLPATNGSAGTGFDTIEDAIQAMKNGEFIIAVDNEDRENEGDLIIAAEHATPEKMAFLIRFSSGVICVAMSGERLDALELPLMVQNNTDTYRTAYTITVDLKNGTSTGISSADRARTIAALADPSSVATDFSRPGHVFPLRAKEGGVLKRVGHTEASVDLCKLAGLQPAAAICEVVLDEGGMARRDELKLMARKWGVKMVTIADIVKYRLEHGFGEGW